MKSICITGIGGYLGLATASRLIKSGHKVVGIGSKSQRPAGLPAEVIYAEIDIRAEKALTTFFAEHQVDSVYHFAGIKYVGKCEADPDLCFSVNTEGTTAVLRAMAEAGVGHIIYASTYAVYDWSGEIINLTETSPTIPHTIYGQSKLAGEQQVLDFTKNGLIKRSHILRYANIIGAIPEYSDYSPQSFVDKIVLAAKTGEAITINGDDHKTSDGSTARDYIDIRDVVTAHELVLAEANSTIYNVSSGTASTLKSIIKLAENLTGKTIPVFVNARNTHDPAIIKIDHQLITQNLAWQTRYSIEETIKLLAERIRP